MRSIAIALRRMKVMRGDDAKNASTERGGYNVATVKFFREKYIWPRYLRRIVSKAIQL